MSDRAPPTLATWLIEHLGPVQHRDSLLGDLIEQYCRGRSRGWYWRQAAAAIVLARLQFLRSMLSIPVAKVVLRLVIECALVTLGVETLTTAATANEAPCKTAPCICTPNR